MHGGITTDRGVEATGKRSGAPRVINMNIKTVFQSNLARILISCSQMNVISTNVRNIPNFIEAYFILCTSEKSIHFDIHCTFASRSTK